MQAKLHTSSDARPFAPTPLPRNGSAGQDGVARRRFASTQLLGDTMEVEILHGESVYRLRLTSLGKLILTK